jgi:hypothetical protein
MNFSCLKEEIIEIVFTWFLPVTILIRKVRSISVTYGWSLQGNVFDETEAYCKWRWVCDNSFLKFTIKLLKGLFFNNLRLKNFY